MNVLRLQRGEGAAEYPHFESLMKRKRIVVGGATTTRDGQRCRVRGIRPERGEVIADFVLNGQVTRPQVAVPIDEF